MLTQEWHFGEPLGEGGFGKVFLAQSDAEPSAVAKFIPKAPGADRELLFENLEGVPNVMPILDKGELGDFWVIVMPRADKSLTDYMQERDGRLLVEEATKVLTDIVEALCAIEDHVVHRDIKPDNVLLLDGRWCLADFGISRYAEATTAPDTRKYAMTPPYAAPEQWRGQRATSATDVYALGVLGYELLAGRLPFDGPEHADYGEQHLQVIPGRIPDIPTKLQSLIAECLYKSPGARPRPQNLMERLAGIDSSASIAQRRLQQANDVAVQRKAELARQQSVARSEWEHRSSLAWDAGDSWGALMTYLQEAIEEHAPASTRSPGYSPWAWSLNDADLIVDEFKTLREAVDLPFEVIAYSNIALYVPVQRNGYRGRSHSLWYCDAQEAGRFRWYETAFWRSPLGQPGHRAYGPRPRTGCSGCNSTRTAYIPSGEAIRGSQPRRRGRIC